MSSFQDATSPVISKCVVTVTKVSEHKTDVVDVAQSSGLRQLITGGPQKVQLLDN